MQTAARKGRVNYEPNGWGEGPRAHPLEGYVSYKAPESGDKARIRPESFADHYSQARQFYISQTPVEQGHMRAALVFELSKCAEPGIRARIVSHLINIDQAMAQDVADRLGLDRMPDAAPAARPTRTDLARSKALSIQLNPPQSFKGRVIGVLTSDGADAAVLSALRDAAADAGVLIKVIAPKIGGVADSAGTMHQVDERLGGAPSVLFDAVAILPGDDRLATSKPAKDFLSDAHAHCKFIACNVASAALFAACGISEADDDGLCAVSDAASVERFLTACATLRYWPREATLNL